MRNAILLFLASALVLAGAAPAFSSRNLVTNGDFHSGPNPGTFITLNGGNTSITGWTVTGTGVDYIGTYWRGYKGGRSIDLDGTPGPGGIKQTISTSPNNRYVVTFQLSGNGDCDPVVKKMEVVSGPVTRTFTWNDAKQGTAQSGKWMAEQVPFRATAAHTTLTFRSLDPVGDCGPVLADVSVKEAH